MEQKREEKMKIGPFFYFKMSTITLSPTNKHVKFLAIVSLFCLCYVQLVMLHSEPEEDAASRPCPLDEHDFSLVRASGSDIKEAEVVW